MHAPPVRALQSPPLMCLQVPGPRHRRAPRLTGTLDSKLNSLEGHLQQLPAAGQRRRRTHDPAVAASAPELGAVARQADEAAGEDDAAWRPISLNQSPLACGSCAAGEHLGLPFSALSHRRSQCLHYAQHDGA